MNKIRQKLEHYMDGWSDSNLFSGTVLITEGNRCLLRKGYGYANYEYQIPNDASTIYPIGSITKQFTAAAILQLVDRGKIKLEDRLKDYLQTSKYAEHITIHHLLSSTSGIPDYTELPAYNPRDRLSVDRILEWLNDRPLHFDPGQGMEKSNSNYVLLAKVVEIVSGIHIEAYYQKYLIEPAQLQFTGVSHNEDVIPNRAYGYSFSGEGVVQAEYYEMSGAYGSGFLYSNTDDLLKWTHALTEGILLKKESYQKMITPYGYLWYLGASMGYGCSVNGDPVDEIIVNGNIYGYTSSVHKYLHGDYTVILLSNNDAVPLGRIAQGIKSILFSKEPQVMVKPATRANVDYNKYTHLIGEYYFPPMGWRFAISFDNGCLHVDRLFIQESKRKKFALQLVAERDELIVFACEVCDSTFSFHLGTNGEVQKVIYVWDTLELPYEKREDPLPNLA